MVILLPGAFGVFSKLIRIKRAFNRRNQPFGNMYINQSGGQMAMTQKLLDRADVITGLQKMGGKTVPLMPSSA